MQHLNKYNRGSGGVSTILLTPYRSAKWKVLQIANVQVALTRVMEREGGGDCFRNGMQISFNEKIKRPWAS
jgi:hypothetical protein